MDTLVRSGRWTLPSGTGGTETVVHTWHSLVGHYVAHRVATRALALTSYRQLRYVLADFAGAMEGAPGELTVADVEAYFAGRPWAASTVRTKLGVIRPFLEWGARGRHVPSGITSELHGPKMPRALPRALTVAQVRRLLAALPDTRARVIVLLMAQGGLRVHEVAGVAMADLDVIERSLRVRGKGGAERELFLSNETLEAVASWLIIRGTSRGPLISSYRDGSGMTPTYIGMLVSAWMVDAGICGSAHALRHTMATELLRGGAHIATVQNALGHANLSTTARYLRVYDTELRSAMTGLTFDHQVPSGLVR